MSSDSRVNAYHWNGNLKVRPFEVRGLAPYVTGGIGSFKSDTVVSDVMIGPTRFEDRRTATNFATNVGAGVTYRIRSGNIAPSAGAIELQTTRSACTEKM